MMSDNFVHEDLRRADIVANPSSQSRKQEVISLHGKRVRMSEQPCCNKN